mmetsp:Transcript_13262/g.27257  ORF Transcript_13262/g.27257 Transcript_13262/m.27257 type:complete len:227 (+) Transcript_13262:614-1294(+)
MQTTFNFLNRGHQATVEHLRLFGTQNTAQYSLQNKLVVEMLHLLLKTYLLSLLKNVMHLMLTQSKVHLQVSHVTRKITRNRMMEATRLMKLLLLMTTKGYWSMSAKKPAIAQILTCVTKDVKRIISKQQKKATQRISPYSMYFLALLLPCFLQIQLMRRVLTKLQLMQSRPLRQQNNRLPQPRHQIMNVTQKLARFPQLQLQHLRLLGALNRASRLRFSAFARDFI